MRIRHHNSQHNPTVFRLELKLNYLIELSVLMWENSQTKEYLLLENVAIKEFSNNLRDRQPDHFCINHDGEVIMHVPE